MQVNSPSPSSAAGLSSRLSAYSKSSKSSSLTDPAELSAAFPEKAVRRTSPSVSSATEVYGFFLWIASALCFVLYLAWAFTPVQVLHKLGITYYPDKHWAIALPAYLCMLVLYAFFLYICANLIVTPPLSSFTTIVDKWSYLQNGPSKRPQEFAVDEIRDIPIEVVNRLLYPREPAKRDEHSRSNASSPMISPILSSSRTGSLAASPMSDFSIG